MTNMIIGTDLSWVAFTDQEHGERCEFLGGRCPAQATHAGIYRIVYRCCHGRILYCLAHRDLILERARWSGNRFSCASVCRPGSLSILIRMEALR